MPRKSARTHDCTNTWQAMLYESLKLPTGYHAAATASQKPINNEPNQAVDFIQRGPPTAVICITIRLRGPGGKGNVELEIVQPLLCRGRSR
jgi:hypothetical protein